MTTRLHHIIREMSQPICMESSVLTALTYIMLRKLRGEAFTGADLHAELGVPVAPKSPLAEVQMAAPAGSEPAKRDINIGVIPVVGVISQRPQSMGTSVMQLQNSLRGMLNARNIDGILFDHDSPGGGVTGVPELAEEIAAAAKVKPMIAFSSGMTASASYWLAAATGELMVSRSAEAGSIGVYMLHEDWSKNLEDTGVKITAVSAGKFKLEGAPWEPLSDAALAKYQARVDEVYGWFTKSVAEARGDTPANVRSGYGEGRVLGAKEAKAANLIDSIGTFDDALARLTAKANRGARRTAARASVLRAREELDASDRRVNH